MSETYPITLINIHLPKEPATCNRSYCLRQISETQWATCYYNEDDDAFYYGHYFTNINDAYVEFRTELNRNMEHFNHLISWFHKHKSYIASQESK